MGNETSSLWVQPASAKINRVKDLSSTNKYAPTAQKTLTNVKFTERDLQKVQKTVLAEYPYLSDVSESMLVCDNSLKDCPIVFVNDAFEEMSMYPKEEIIGRNCRFLQGRFTRAETVKEIRRAVDDGLEIDVEILNYRKDSVPFWNRFLMLPVHKGGKAKKGVKITHFIAVQKDISIIKVGAQSAEVWTPPEVAIWLDHVGLGHLCAKFIDGDVTGEVLLDMVDADIQSLGVSDEADRQLLLNRLESLQRDPKSGFSSVMSEVDLAAYASAAPRTSNAIESEPDIEPPMLKAGWSKGKRRNSNTSYKVTLDDGRIEVVRVSRGAKFQKVKRSIERRLGFPVSLFSVTRGSINNTDDLDDLRSRLERHGRTVPLFAQKNFGVPSIKGFSTSVIESFGVGVLLLDVDDQVAFVSARALALMGGVKSEQVVGLPLNRVFEGLTIRYGNYRQSAVVAGDGRRMAIMIADQVRDSETGVLLRAVTLDVMASS